MRPVDIVAFVLLSAGTVVAQVKPLATLESNANGGEVTCIGFTKDSRFFFSGSLDTYISVWTTASSSKTAEILPAPSPKSPSGEHQDEFRGLTACAVEPVTSRLLIASGGDSVATYSLPEGKEEINRRFDVYNDSLAISADNKEVALGSGHQVSLYSARQWRSVERYPFLGSLEH